MEPPKIPSMLKGVRTKPRGFNFIPRYYDKDKEDFEKRVKQAEKEMELKENGTAESRVRMKQAMDEHWGARHTAVHNRGRTKRLAMIFLGLIGALYLYYEYYLKNGH